MNAIPKLTNQVLLRSAIIADFMRRNITRKVYIYIYFKLSQLHSLTPMMENAMNFLLSILFPCLLYIAVCAVDETSSTSRSSYFTTRENKRLEGHDVKRFNSPSLLSCSHQCARNIWCTSANFKMPLKENGQGTCELNKHNISVVSGENTEFRDQQDVMFLMFLEVKFIGYRIFLRHLQIRPRLVSNCSFFLLERFLVVCKM